MSGPRGLSRAHPYSQDIIPEFFGRQRALQLGMSGPIPTYRNPSQSLKLIPEDLCRDDEAPIYGKGPKINCIVSVGLYREARAQRRKL